MNTPQRIIDANANRAREALRVLEEAARFIVEDADLSHQLKTMRHDFTTAIKPLDHLIFHRDTAGDVGTTLTTEAEQTRDHLNDIIRAAGSRLAEALRAIEEYAKLDSQDPDASASLAQTAEKLRYQSYDITKQLVLALGSGKAPQWRLCLLLTQSLCKTPWQSVLEHAVNNGVNCIQIREKELDAGPLLDHIHEVIDLVQGRAAVIINDRPDLALLAGADGVHLGQTDLSPLDARRLLGDQMIIGVSTSNLDEAKQAKADGADYCGIGPMFLTTTKHKPDLAGPDYLRPYLAWDGLPHLAIGGIHADNVNELVEVGCQGIAVSSAICSAQNPAAATTALAHAMAERAMTQDSQVGINTSA